MRPSQEGCGDIRVEIGVGGCCDGHRWALPCPWGGWWGGLHSGWTTPEDTYGRENYDQAMPSGGHSAGGGGGGTQEGGWQRPRWGSSQQTGSSCPPGASTDLAALQATHTAETLPHPQTADSQGARAARPHPPFLLGPRGPVTQALMAECVWEGPGPAPHRGEEGSGNKCDLLCTGASRPGCLSPSQTSGSGCEDQDPQGTESRGSPPGGPLPTPHRHPCPPRRRKGSQLPGCACPSPALCGPAPSPSSLIALPARSEGETIYK